MLTDPQHAYLRTQDSSNEYICAVKTLFFKYILLQGTVNSAKSCAFNSGSNLFVYFWKGSNAVYTVSRDPVPEGDSYRTYFRQGAVKYVS